ncbi:MAG: VOC family protein [Acidimicrobiales bacterium]
MNSPVLQPELNAITLLTNDMARAVAFYATAGFPIVFGGPDSTFSSLGVGQNFINLSVEPPGPGGHWGRFIIHVPSPDEMWQRFVDAGYEPAFEPRDAPWGERYFHINDPDGHEVSFACPMDELPANTEWA